MILREAAFLGRPLTTSQATCGMIDDGRHARIHTQYLKDTVTVIVENRERSEKNTLVSTIQIHKGCFQVSRCKGCAEKDSPGHLL